MPNEIWKWFGSGYRVHCQNREDYESILEWQGCRWGGVYCYPDGHLEFDVNIPARWHHRAARILGLRPKNSANPVVENQRLTGGADQN
jgi:hypothetical protein